MSSKEGEGDISAASDESNESKSADEFVKPSVVTESITLEIDKPGHSKTTVPEDHTLTEVNVPEQNPEIAADVEKDLAEQEEKAMVEMAEECSNDTLEDEIKLLWDDDDNSEDLLEKSQEETKKSPEETKESPDDSQKSPDDTKSSNIDEIDKDIQIVEPSKILTSDGNSEVISNINDSMTSLNDTDMSININTEHAVTKPDVMLDIPTQELLDMEQDFNSDEPDEETHSSGNSIENKDHGLKKPDLMLEIPMQELLEEEQDLINLEMSSDKDSNPDETNDLTDLLSKVNAEIAETISAIDDSDACKLEIPDEVDNTESGQKEVNISSDEESNEEQGQPDSGQPDTVNAPTDKSNLIEAIQNEVQALADTMSSIEEQELLDSPPPEPEKIGLTKASKMVTNAPKSDEKVVRIVPKTAEERKREIDMKVSTLINNIEEEMQLIDAQNEAEAMDVDVQEIKKVTEDVISLDDVPEKVTSENLMEDETDDVEIVNVTHILQSDKDKGTKKDIELTKKRKVQNKDKITVSDSDNIDSSPDVEPESSETTEKEAKLKEEDEIALAVKTIEESTEIVEPTPVVSVLKADELSEISVIEDEDQSISLVLDDDSVEMEMQPQASVDESEISVIQDSDDEDPVILVPDAENVPPVSTDKQGMEESSIEKNDKQEQKYPKSQLQ
ncbi:uncharacterized protein [Epargyreus clarus]|uniref:uncharacterized protein n=1 Tax=Epargyreus clarus TaxID=520877 RepID=UPI003C2B6AA8